MESSLPPINRSPVEKEPTPVKPRRNFFEALGIRRSAEKAEAPAPKKVEAVGGTERKAEKAPETPGEKPERRKRVGERLLAMAGVKPKEPGVTAEAAAESEPAKEKQEKEPEEEKAPERSRPALERMVDGARELGGNVLRLLDRAREIVTDADSNEPTTERTDTKPLDKAERKISDALGELDEAATESYEYSGGDGGGDGPGRPEMPIWQLRASQEAAAANAWREAEEQIETEARRREQRLATRQVGALALVALLVAGGTALYSWRKVRHLREEQKELVKRDAKQETALRKSEAKIEELEQHQAHGALGQLERQAYVGEVSKFAVAQAEQIQEVAGDVREERTAIYEHPRFNYPPEKVVEKVRVAPPEVKKTSIEKATELVGSGVNKTRDALTGGVVSAGGVVDFLSRKVVQPIKDAIQKPTDGQKAQPPVHHDPIQTWLNGTLLILGILLLLALALAIL